MSDTSYGPKAYSLQGGDVFVIASGGELRIESGASVTDDGTQASHVADASAAHAITDPADSPADADALRDDLVANAIPEIEAAMDALGGKINAILAALEGAGILATS